MNRVFYDVIQPEGGHEQQHLVCGIAPGRGQDVCSACLGLG